MTKKEFLEELRRELSFLPEEELNEAIRYYDEYISEAGDDEEETIEAIGTPEKAARDFKQEYCDKTVLSPDVPAVVSGKKETQVWKYIIICILVVAIAVPVLGYVIPSIAGVCVLLILALIIMKVIRDKSIIAAEENADIAEPSGEIRNININLTAAILKLKTGGKFSVETSQQRAVKLQSFVKDGIWYIESKNVRAGYKDATVTVTVPESFRAVNAKIHTKMGKIFAEKLSADNVSMSADMSKCEIKDMDIGKLDIHCGMGDVTADGNLNGDVHIDCGMGNVKLHARNNAAEFNYQTSVGMGKIDIDGKRVSGAGGCSAVNTDALHNINVKCGMGNVKITFGN